MLFSVASVSLSIGRVEGWLLWVIIGVTGITFYLACLLLYGAFIIVEGQYKRRLRVIGYERVEQMAWGLCDKIG